MSLIDALRDAPDFAAFQGAVKAASTEELLQGKNALLAVARRIGGAV